LPPSWKASPFLFLIAAVEGKIDTRRHADTPTRFLSRRQVSAHADTDTLPSVVVAVVNIRHVNMTMHYWLVPVPMRMRLSWWIGRQMVV
jgi:hypothetical protein